jgi:hypothetical protein
MLVADVIREVSRFVGVVQEADLESLIFQVRGATGVTEVDCTVDDCGSVAFVNSSDAVVVVDAGDIVGVRCAASGVIEAGTLTDSY